MRIRAGIPVARIGRDGVRAQVIAHQDRPAREVAELVGRSVGTVNAVRSQLIGEGVIRPKIIRPRKWAV